MATLYVENVPDDLYKALRERSRANHRSMAAEVIALLRTNVPTAEELARREEFWKRTLEIRSRPSPGKGPFPSTEEMLREDRSR